MYDPKKDPALADNPYLTNYEIEYDFMMDPCSNPNPPSWCEDGTGGPCNNPDHGPFCDGVHAVPCDASILMLFLTVIFGVGLLKKKFVFSRYM